VWLGSDGAVRFLLESDAMRWIRPFAVVVAALGIAAPAAATGERAEESLVVGGLSFREQVEVTVVNLDVYVRDADGDPVTGLRAEDFRVLQDGVAMPVSNFAAFTEEIVRAVVSEGGDGPAATPAPDAAPAPEPDAPEAEPLPRVQPVFIVLYVDNENIQPLDRTRVLTQVRQFVDQVMLPHVQVMVLSGERSLRVVQPFTDKPADVRAALREMARLSGARIDLDGTRRRIIGEMQRHVERGRSERYDDYAARTEIEGEVRSYGEQLAMELDQAISRVREAALMLAGLSGRKIMIHVSSGLPMVAAKDLVNHLGSLFERGSTLPLLMRFDRRSAFRSLAATANAQGLSFYTIDATGLSGTAGVSAEHSRPIDPMVSAIHVNNMQEPLMYLAERTGGRAILDSNDVTGGLMELKEDLLTYYSIGYRVSTGGGDVVHAVEVDVPAHPDYTVLHRRTFVEKSRETQVQDAVATGLILGIDDNPMRISVAAGPGGATAEERRMVPIEVSVPISAVALVPEGSDHVGRVVVFVATRDDEGRQSAVQRREVELRFPSEGLEQHLGERSVIELQLLMRPGFHRIAVGVLDVITRQASYEIVGHDVGP